MKIFEIGRDPFAGIGIGPEHYARDSANIPPRGPGVNQVRQAARTWERVRRPVTVGETTQVLSEKSGFSGTALCAGVFVGGIVGYILGVGRGID